MVSFINHNQQKSKDQIFWSLLGITSSNISSYEYTLKECTMNLENSSIDSLASMQNILSSLTTSDTKEKEYFTTLLE